MNPDDPLSRSHPRGPARWWPLLLCAWLAVAPPASAAGAGTRQLCGWFHNPSPGNASLVDRHGEWTIAMQGAYEARGAWPVFSASRWVRTNGSYGHGCACLRVRAKVETMQVVQIVEAASRPLRACRQDPAQP